MTRSCDQSSVRARRTAVSVTSLPSWVARSDGGERDLGGEDFVRGEGERRDLDGAGGDGRLLPRLVAAQGEDVGEDGGGGDEIRHSVPRRAGCAEQVERDGGAFGDQAREQGAGGFRVRRGLVLAEVLPRVASTKVGAGARAGRGARRRPGRCG